MGRAKEIRTRITTGIMGTRNVFSCGGGGRGEGEVGLVGRMAEKGYAGDWGCEARERLDVVAI